jgi:hypothetical protein
MILFGCQFAEHGAEDVGARRQMARAEAIADLLGFQGRHDSKGGAKFGGDSCSSGSDKFVRFVDLAQRDAGQDFESGRRGERVRAVGAFDGSSPLVQTRNENFLHSQRFDSHACAHDIRYGIQRAHFVKCHFFRRLAVDLALGHCDSMEDIQRVLFYERRKLACFDQSANVEVAPSVPVLVLVVVMRIVRVFAMTVIMCMGMNAFRIGLTGMVMMLAGFTVLVAGLMLSVGVRGLMRMLVSVLMVMILRFLVVMMMFVHVLVLMPAAIFVTLILVVGMGRALVNAEFHAFDVLPFFPFEVHVKGADLELGEFPLQSGWFHAEIDEGADGHVAANAGDAIEKENAHGI